MEPGTHRGWIYSEGGPGHGEMPFPPPPFPPGPGRDVLFFTRPAPPPPGEGEEGRAAEDIMMRRVPADVARRFRAAAGGRGMTHAQYLTALIGLHEAMRARADGGDEAASGELARLGLGSVTV
jgi:hypothetical protein